MGALRRTWHARGSVLVGTRPGAKDLKLIPAQAGRIPAGELADIAISLNELTPGQAAVYRAARAYEAKLRLPTPVLEIAGRTGLSPSAVHRAYERLVEAGLGRRPPVRSGGNRPFFTLPALVFPEPEGPAS